MNEKRLPIIIFILPIAAVVTTVVIFLFTYCIQQTQIMKDVSNNIRNLYVKQITNTEIKKINSSFDILIYNCNDLDSTLKDELKMRVDTVYDIMMDIYKNNQDLPKYKVVKVIKDAIRSIRYAQGLGYFFIYSMDGVNILLPPDSSAEGKNFINFKDAHGHYPIREAIKIVKKNKSGYLEWYWSRPHKAKYNLKNSKMYRKIGYIRYFEPLNWFVGTGLYVDDEIEYIKKEFIDAYIKERKKNGEYFMALDFLWSGKAKVLGSSIHIKTEYVDKNFIDGNGKKYMDKIFEDIYRGKFEHLIQYSNSLNRESYIYFRFYKDINLLLISRIDIEDMESIISSVKSQYATIFQRYMKDIFIVSVILTLIISGVFFVVSKMISKIFFKYQYEVRKREEKLQNLASYDELTGIYNRRKFYEILDYEMNMVKRYNQKLSLIMFDLDYFKNVNDRYGHNVGDKVLRIIAKSIRRNIRLTDTFARWGGEEFFIILPKTPIKEAAAIAEHLRKIIENIRFGRVCRITCSFGVTYFRNGDTRDSFVNRADKAMYKAKTKGRNRVEYL